MKYATIINRRWSGWVGGGGERALNCRGKYFKEKQLQKQSWNKSPSSFLKYVLFDSVLCHFVNLPICQPLFQAVPFSHAFNKLNVDMK
jgi:hypothetical protein